MAVIDISPTLHPGIAVWPGDVGFSREVACSISEGANIDLSAIRTTVHVGAHTDAPNHYHLDGVGIDERSLELYYGPVEVLAVDVGRGERIPPVGAVRAPRVLFKTGTFPDPDAFNRDFAALSVELVEDLARQGVRLVGLDTPSVDPFSSKALEAHQAIYNNDMAILEGVVLDHVEPGLYTLIALPLKLAGADASPVRAALVTP